MRRLIAAGLFCLATALALVGMARAEPAELRAAQGAARSLAAVGVVAGVHGDLRAATPAVGRRVAEAPAAPSLAAPDPVVQVMMSQVISATLRQYVGNLSGEWPVLVGGAPYTITTRVTDSGEPIAKAVQWTSEHLADLGMAVTQQVWQAGRPPNVIGELTGSTAPGDILILSAHLDSISGGATAPGADDNASGAAGVLAAADVLSAYRDAWRCTLRFALWTGEEQGLLGSREYARRAAEAQEAIRGVLNLDMIAWNTPGSSPDIDLHATASLPASVVMAQLFADVVAVYNLDLVPQVVTAGIRGSDHASFWDNGYPAIMAIEDYYPQKPDFNPYYHTAADRLDKFDMAYYTAMAQAALATFVHFSDCLATGVLQGHVTWSGSGDPVVDAAVAAVNAAGHTFSARVDAGGFYSLTPPAGTYTVTASAPGVSPVVSTGVFVGADAATTQDFVLGCAGSGSIGRLVWLDDGDGQPGPGEPHLQGVLLRLTEAGPDALLGTPDDADLGATMTDLSGVYTFTCLPPGFYRVTIDPASPSLAGLLLVYPDSSGHIDVTLAAGEAYTTANFGYRSTTAAQVLSFQARSQPEGIKLQWHVLLAGAGELRFQVLAAAPGGAGWQPVTTHWVSPIRQDGQVARYEVVVQTRAVQYLLRDEAGTLYGPWSVSADGGRVFLPLVVSR